MLSHCLIFLCLSFSASCKPTNSPLSNVIDEACRYLKTMRGKDTVIFENETLKELTIPAPFEESCALYSLDEYIRLLSLVKTEDSNHLANLRSCLKAIAEAKSLVEFLGPQKDHQKCETSSINPDDFLKELSNFLDELNNIILSTINPE